MGVSKDSVCAAETWDPSVWVPREQAVSLFIITYWSMADILKKKSVWEGMRGLLEIYSSRGLQTTIAELRHGSRNN